MNSILLSTSYFPSISYISAILKSQNVIIEQYENFTKKTLRNRCKIYAANGIVNLSIPISKLGNKKQLIKDTQIDYSIKWQKQHFKSIESAYKSSPFYEYLIDDYLIFFQKEYKFLLDFNVKILEVITDFIGIDYNLQFSNSYIPIDNSNKDFRYLVEKNTCHDKTVNSKSYYQVFADKHGFKADLSIIDLIFNLGNESYKYLQEF